ncbi:Zinc finger, RING-type [Penicillium griseofulvum]|uniref:RING-type E3 ubiquitin transferase n=1 Tax=Penicillium patulum TaxID=5078 RepID=A0A135LIF0_PENPA|nr:Zinc finger, RING-type [Penicillium griseofulvum]KXG48746.1 Zinc finger, RING-type [Penicillium griseofulvum]
MRPPRLLIVLFCLIFFPILLTFFSALTSPDVASPNTLAGETTGLRALFSFNIPSSLFPPSAIISLTDDNSTFFLARPAAFGPLLPTKGLSGQLWVGSGFGEGGLAGVEGELGCSDIPGWGEGANHKKQDKTTRSAEQSSGMSGGGTVKDQSSNRPRSVSQADTTPQNDRDDPNTPPLTNDGTDDHLHHPLPESGASNPGMSQRYGDHVQSKPSAHADIQSLQETAEIQGKVVLLSRGGCGFLEKAKWAQRRGGVALIVGDDTRGGNLVTMYARGDTSNVTIPALFTSHTTAHLLSSLVPGHASGTAGLGDVSKSSQAKLAGQADADKERVISTTATTIPSPTASSHLTAKERPAPSYHSNGGFFRAIGAFLGLCDKNGGSRHLEDSRRPPSSGNIDWINLGSWDEKEAPSNAWRRSTDPNDRGRAKEDTYNSHKADMSPESFEDDDFVIGVQDWRDPDLMPPRSTASPTASTSIAGKDTSNTASADKDAASSPDGLQGGSITPGSGEYQSIDKSSASSHGTRLKGSEKESFGSHGKSGSFTKGWFSSHFGWGDDTQQDPQPSSSPSLQKSTAADQKMQNSPHTSSRLSGETSEHEGLWVTMTPTSMSSSPFFDTLLVLVVSPLLTLTAVYALLLLRSRIRRRRWRAPKSVIERLPVRTYHTIATSSSSSSNSTRPPSPGPLSPTSPLLGNESRPSASRSNRSRSQTFSGTMLDSSVAPKEEKCNMQNGSTLWRRKYTGRQVECVVCLEEYIDGLSRVMRLPCGHEFHVECITPWLTTRRRTCPICKGDVVRSLGHSQPDDSQGHRDHSNDDFHSTQPMSRGSASSAPVQIEGVNEDPSDREQNAGLLDHANSAPQSSWRNLATLSFSALSGDTIWHQARADRNR